jgi:hypothetical protein
VGFDWPGIGFVCTCVVLECYGPSYNWFSRHGYLHDDSCSAPAMFAQGTWLGHVESKKAGVDVERAVVDTCLFHDQDKLEEAFRQMAALREENDALRAQAASLLEEAKDETAEAPASEELQVCCLPPVAHLLSSHNICVWCSCRLFQSHCCIPLDICVTRWRECVFFHGRSTPWLRLMTLLHQTIIPSVTYLTSSLPPCP